MDTYYPFISLSVKHDFAADSQQLLRFTPFAKSQSFMHNVGLLFRATNTGFELISNQRTNDILREYTQSGGFNESVEDDLPVDTPPHLVFSAIPESPYFNHFTQTNTRPGESCYLLSNQDLNAGSGSLHSTPFIDDSSLHAFRNSPYESLLLLGHRVSTPILIVSISLKNLSLETASPSYDYNVAFASQSNYWKYLITGAENFKNLQIVDLDNTTQFDYFGKEALGTHQSLVFMSSAPIPFKQNHRRFQLQDSDPPHNHIVVEQLPAASIDGGFLKKPDETARVSEIFVNL